MSEPFPPIVAVLSFVCLGSAGWFLIFESTLQNSKKTNAVLSLGAATVTVAVLGVEPVAWVAVRALSEEKLYYGFAAMTGALGYSHFAEEEDSPQTISTVAKTSAGGFLIGYGAWSALPSWYHSWHSDRRSSSLDVLMVLCNASVVSLGIQLLTKPSRIANKMFGAALMGYSLFYLAPQKLRELII